VLAIGEHDLGKRDTAFVHHRIANDGEGLLAGLAVGYDVIGPVEVAGINLLDWDKLADVERSARQVPWSSSGAGAGLVTKRVYWK
jgi:hypothetical protein